MQTPTEKNMANQEHMNHDVRQIKCNRVTKFYVHDLVEKKDIPKVFDTEQEAIDFSQKVARRAR